MADTESYDVFISYSELDYLNEQKEILPGNVITRITDSLTEAGISYWIGRGGDAAGEDFVDKITSKIDSSRVFVFISTENSNNKSRYTSKEISFADAKLKPIIPVRIDKSAYKNSVLFRISNIDQIDYYANPEKGIVDLIEAIKKHLAPIEPESSSGNKDDGKNTNNPRSAEQNPDSQCKHHKTLYLIAASLLFMVLLAFALHKILVNHATAPSTEIEIETIEPGQIARLLDSLSVHHDLVRVIGSINNDDFVTLTKPRYGITRLDLSRAYVTDSEEFILFFDDSTMVESLCLPETGDRIIGPFYKATESITHIRLNSTTLLSSNNAFETFPNLQTIECDENNQKYQLYDGCLYSSDYSILYIVPPGRTDRLTVHTKCELLSNGCCWNSKFSEVILPDGLLYIDNWAFANCTMLREIQLPPSLKGIGSNAFYNTPIRKLELPDNIFVLGDLSGSSIEYIKLNQFIPPFYSRGFDSNECYLTNVTVSIPVTDNTQGLDHYEFWNRCKNIDKRFDDNPSDCNFVTLYPIKSGGFYTGFVNSAASSKRAIEETDCRGLGLIIDKDYWRLANMDDSESSYESIIFREDGEAYDRIVLYNTKTNNILLDHNMARDNGIDPKQTILKLKIKNNDWEAVKSLAEMGYIPAYISLANHYLEKSSTHALADKYAKKAMKHGYTKESERIINQLKQYRYYDQ